MALTPKQLAECAAFEAEWDPRLGGPHTIYLREMLAYCAQRLEMAGASRAYVVEYLAAVWELSDSFEDEQQGGES
jgi:hypothetical protein